MADLRHGQVIRSSKQLEDNGLIDIYPRKSMSLTYIYIFIHIYIYIYIHTYIYIYYKVYVL